MRALKTAVTAISVVLFGMGAFAGDKAKSGKETYDDFGYSMGVVLDGSGRPVRDGSGECVLAAGGSLDYAVMAECGYADKTVKPVPAPDMGKGKKLPAPVLDEPETELPIADESEVISEDSLILSETVHFEFDESFLSDAAMDRLDSLLTEMSHAEDVIEITVSGYADRIGTDAYNMALSERRALAVQNYLLERLDTMMADDEISGYRMDVLAFGEQVSLTSECHGDLTRNELIQCLQPDRRATVEAVVNVSGPEELM